jgi:hypothetical protein
MEVKKEQPPAGNLSATVKRLLQGTNLVNQKYFAKSCLLLDQWI